MVDTILVTGNANKLREYADLIPPDAGISLVATPLDLTEIQSLDTREIVTHKLKEAYEHFKQPVIVDDTSAGLDSLGGLPGPFIRFFLKKLGNDALFKLAKEEHERVTVTCLVGYYDGEKMFFGEGIVTGTVTAPRGENNFGFDCVVVPDGETRTVAEMTPAEKSANSHRSQAIKDLLRQLKK